MDICPIIAHLPHAVYPLEEDWAPLRVVVFVLAVADPVAELVPETQPLLLYQHHEAGQGPDNKIIK